MIPLILATAITTASKPRASGDDPTDQFLFTVSHK